MINMVTYGDTIECPMCGKYKIEWERQLSTQEFREECTYCGYFHEATFGFDMTEEELVKIHFITCRCNVSKKRFYNKIDEKV